MAKNRKKPEGAEPAKGRAAVKYVALPVDLWEALQACAQRDERSVNSSARRAIRQFLEGEGLWPPPTK